jgi:hypothetical protein
LAKYVLVSFAVMALLAAALFGVIAWLNGDDAAAGPPVLIAVNVREGVVDPPTITVERGRLVNLRIFNESQDLIVAAASGGIEQLPPETATFDLDAQTQPLPRLELRVPGRGVNQAYVRFNDGGRRDVRIETPGRPETAQTLTVVVE